MNAFEIEGGNKLKGTLVPQGAKNEALQVICTVLLTSKEVIIKNIPDIRDVNILISLLKDLGVKVNNTAPEEYTFKADDINFDYLHTEAFIKNARSIRGSIMIVGPLLTRFGVGYIPKPGGDKIGRRRMDTHFQGFIKLGAHFEYDEKNYFYKVTSDGLKGTYMLLDEASVTGTANIIMAACMAEGTTTIFNAACEPYIQQLCKMLNSMGANISGIGSNLLSIKGVDEMNGCTHTLLPDMIEIGSFMGLAAMTESEIRIKDCCISQLGLIPEVFKRIGISFSIENDDIIVYGNEPYEIESFIDGSILTIADAPWPGLTPDLISILLVVATQAKGSVLIHQKMFESRLFFVDKLIDMGAQIILCDPHRANVIGLARKVKLRGILMSSPDIRAGISLLIAALSAEGKSTILNAHQIDRGYQHIVERLQSLGADIKRV
ncbi:MAG TPA: UDP-N-acetylglucosamine 1-carboxyvinyltransferase [Bacteroidetes bacterium]|nr:UDP-N-acetylglucosamine 1-carboxyvinyltransferase [Bacteroidota bacterium]